VTQFSSNPISVNAGQGVNVQVIDVGGEGSISRVDFVVASPAIAVAIPQDLTAPFGTTITGVSAGTTTITATVYKSPPTPNPCTAVATINVGAAASVCGTVVFNAGVFNPPSISIVEGGTQRVGTGTIMGTGTITRVDFSTGNGATATTAPLIDNDGAPWVTWVTGVAAGSTALTANITKSPPTTGACTGILPISVIEASDAWFQAVNGDVISSGDLISQIPDTCVESAGCTPYFITDGEGGYPGVAIYGDGASYDFEAGGGTGDDKVSTQSWLADTNYSGEASMYTYDTLVSYVPSSIMNNLSNLGGSVSDISGASTDSDGYEWYRASGDLTITGDISISGGRKVVVLVEGSLTIEGKINLDNPEDDFFMALVGGDIDVSPVVTSTPSEFGLEGIYFADGSFRTLAAAVPPDVALRIRGSLVAGSVNFGRNLAAGNDIAPAEMVEYSAEIILNYPKTLSRRHVVWREVAP
jgi:hypothetical protein